MNRELTIEEMSSELEALRETPSQEFAGRLDARAAAGFPRRGSRGLERLHAADSLRRVARRAREKAPRRPLLPALAAVASVVVVATAVVVSTEGGGSNGDSSQIAHNVSKEGSSGAATAGGGPAAQAPNAVGAGGLPSQVSGLRAQQDKAGVIAPEPSIPGQTPPPGTAPGVRDRQVERSAELTLGTDPEQVQDVTGKVIDVVGRYRGFVLQSSVRDGTDGDAGARFELLIPSARLSPALADLSGIAEVRSRSENSLDITAPYVSAREHLRDNRAEAEGLLRQLADADTDTERAGVKAQLRVVRGRIAAFRAQVDRLERRANFSRVSLDVVTGKSETFPAAGGDWTVGDALDDAGRVLAVAAGVVLLGAALILPVALLGGAFWGGRQIYLRRARAAALEG
jgi:Domain of unknown function (DUF4349)